MKGIHSLGKVLAKILEIFHWVGATLMAAATVCAVISPDLVGLFVGFDGKECCGANLDVYGFEINAPFSGGQVDTTYFCLFGIGAIIILSVMAMVFHSLHLIFKRTENSTPFQNDIIRLIRKIGILTLSVPVVGFIMSIIIRLIVGVENTETSIDTSGIFMGIIILCLAEFFVHGAKIEKEVDGLL